MNTNRADFGVSFYFLEKQAIDEVDNLSKKMNNEGDEIILPLVVELYNALEKVESDSVVMGNYYKYQHYLSNLGRDSDNVLQEPIWPSKTFIKSEPIYRREWLSRIKVKIENGDTISHTESVFVLKCFLFLKGASKLFPKEWYLLPEVHFSQQYMQVIRTRVPTFRSLSEDDNFMPNVYSQLNAIIDDDFFNIYSLNRNDIVALHEICRDTSLKNKFPEETFFLKQMLDVNAPIAILFYF